MRFSHSDKPWSLLQGLQIPVPRKLRRGVDGRKFCFGECFVRSYQYVVQHTESGPLLVHGTSELGGFDRRHAWVELPGDVVCEGVLQRFYPREVYYRMTDARPHVKYTAGAASIVLFGVNRHRKGPMWDYGDAWETMLRLHVDSNEPETQLIDHKLAQQLVLRLPTAHQIAEKRQQIEEMKRLGQLSESLFT